jgi:hypothetical protein
MSAFPLLKTGAVLQYPASQSSSHSTCVLRFVDGSEQRFREQAQPLRKWTIRLELLDETEVATLEGFFQSQLGRLGDFAFTDPWDGTIYPSCSLEEDSITMMFEDPMRGKVTVVVRENRI